MPCQMKKKKDYTLYTPVLLDESLQVIMYIVGFSNLHSRWPSLHRGSLVNVPIRRKPTETDETGLVGWLCWCLTALWHILGSFMRGQLTSPHCSWASLLCSLPVRSENTVVKFWPNLKESMWSDRGLNQRPLHSQSDSFPTALRGPARTPWSTETAKGSGSTRPISISAHESTRPWNILAGSTRPVFFIWQTVMLCVYFMCKNMLLYVKYVQYTNLQHFSWKLKVLHINPLVQDGPIRLTNGHMN